MRNAVRFLNPVVRYLQDTLGKDNVDADVMTGRTLRLKIGGTATDREVTMPEGVENFIRSFNRGCYPDLELDK